MNFRIRLIIVTLFALITLCACEEYTVRKETGVSAATNEAVPGKEESVSSIIIPVPDPPEETVQETTEETVPETPEKAENTFSLFSA